MSSTITPTTVATAPVSSAPVPIVITPPATPTVPTPVVQPVSDEVSFSTVPAALDNGQVAAVEPTLSQEPAEPAAATGFTLVDPPVELHAAMRLIQDKVDDLQSSLRDLRGKVRSAEKHWRGRIRELETCTQLVARLQKAAGF